MQPKPDPWHDTHEKKFQALLNSIRDAEDEDVDGEGESTLLRDSLGRQVADVASAIEDNDPAELAEAVRNQTEAIVHAGHRIADSQIKAAKEITGAIEGHGEIVASASPAQPPTPATTTAGGRFTDLAVLLAVVAIGSRNQFDLDNENGRFLKESFDDLSVVARLRRPSDFSQTMLKRLDQAPPLIARMTEEDFKSFYGLAKEVVKVNF